MILQVYDSAHAMDLTAWRLYLAEQYENGTPLSFLADCEPQTYQLTPEQIDAVFGINTIWSDSGDVTVTYDRQYLIHGWNAIGAYVSPTEEASDADMYFIDLGGTYYGGTIDFLSGKMLVTHGSKQIDGAYAWSVSSNDGYFLNKGYHNMDVDASKASISNLFLYSSTVWTDKHFGFNDSQTLWVGDTGLAVYGSLQKFKDALDATPLQIVYPLATPIEVQLTPQQIELLVGTNHIWSDDGNIVHVKTRTFENEEDSEIIDVDYITTIQYDGIMCGEGIVPKVEM